MNEKLISIVIPTMGAEIFLKNCLLSLKKSTHKNFNVIIVDNSSKLNEKEFLDKKIDIKLAKNKENKGFAVAVNKGIKLALKENPKYIFLLNDDTIIKKDCIKIIYDLMEQNTSFGICSPTILDGKKKKLIQSQGERFIKLLGLTFHINQNKIYKSRKNYFEPDFVSGCAMMIKKEVIEKIGFFDENFFSYYEDLDFCLRAKKKKFKNVIKKDAIIWHFGSVTAKKFTLKTYNKLRSFLIFMRKKTPIKLWPFYIAAFMFFYLPLSLIQNFNFSIKYFKSVFGAVKKGMFDEIKKDGIND